MTEKSVPKPGEDGYLAGFILASGAAPGDVIPIVIHDLPFLGQVSKSGDGLRLLTRADKVSALGIDRDTGGATGIHLASNNYLTFEPKVTLDQLTSAIVCAVRLAEETWSRSRQRELVGAIETGVRLVEKRCGYSPDNDLPSDEDTAELTLTAEGEAAATSCPCVGAEVDETEHTQPEILDIEAYAVLCNGAPERTDEGLMKLWRQEGQAELAAQVLNDVAGAPAESPLYKAQRVPKCFVGTFEWQETGEAEEDEDGAAAAA